VHVRWYGGYLGLNVNYTMTKEIRVYTIRLGSRNGLTDRSEINKLYILVVLFYSIFTTHR